MISVHMNQEVWKVLVYLSIYLNSSSEGSTCRERVHQKHHREGEDTSNYMYAGNMIIQAVIKVSAVSFSIVSPWPLTLAEKNRNKYHKMT